MRTVEQYQEEIKVEHQIHAERLASIKARSYNNADDANLKMLDAIQKEQAIHERRLKFWNEKIERRLELDAKAEAKIQERLDRIAVLEAKKALILLEKEFHHARP